MNEQISGDNIDVEQSIYSRFQRMKSKMDHKRKDLEISNKQRMIDKLLTQLEVQAERAQVLINNKKLK